MQRQVSQELTIEKLRRNWWNARLRLPTSKTNIGMCGQLAARVQDLKAKRHRP
jgi:hypothetical protein